eukprot:6478992-Amphidinium_carterae.2
MSKHKRVINTTGGNGACSLSCRLLTKLHSRMGFLDMRSIEVSNNVLQGIYLPKQLSMLCSHTTQAETIHTSATLFEGEKVWNRATQNKKGY